MQLLFSVGFRRTILRFYLGYDNGKNGAFKHGLILVDENDALSHSTWGGANDALRHHFTL